jgi:hypothetical protein
MEKNDRIAADILRAEAGERQPRKFRHFIYFRDRLKAEALAKKLRLDGFQVESRLGADYINWLLLVQHLLIPDDQAIEELVDQLTGLAQANDGEYDGWEADTK